MKTKTRAALDRQAGWHIPLVFLVAVSLVPVLFAVFYSFKSLQSIYGDAGLFSGFTLENFREIARQLPIVRITLNTLTVAVLVTACKLLTSILAAYAFVFTEFRGKNVFYFVLISTIFIPFTVTMIPNYITVSRLNLFDSVLGIVLPQLADATGIFLLRQTMRSIPKSLIEIAGLDGISRMRTLWDIILPICRPSIVATGIIFFINSWNEYVWPTLILRSKDNYTLSLAMQLFSSSEAGTEFTTVMAMAVLSMLMDSYQKRDQVGLVAFRGGEAAAVLELTRSVELAQRELQALPTGGRTPLAAGLEEARRMLERQRRRVRDSLPLLVLITDGRANFSRGGDPVEEALRAARRVAEAHIPAVVIDTERQFVSLGLAAQVAQVMGAPCYRVEELRARPLAQLVRGHSPAAG